MTQSLEVAMKQQEVRARLQHIRQRISRAAQRADRDPGSITLLAAAKTVEPERIRMMIDLGLRHMGENRVQEAMAKFKQSPSLRQAAVWHMIGHLQTNKVRRALELFDVIQSVDSVRLAHQIARVAKEWGRGVPVYIEVNVGPEQTKHGVPSDQLIPLSEAIANCPQLRLEGFMTVPPYIEDPEAVRPYFRKLRQLLEEINSRNLFQNSVTGLSMGMSHDFEVAIEEGATIVRLGRALWGPRPG